MYTRDKKRATFSEMTSVMKMIWLQLIDRMIVLDTSPTHSYVAHRSLELTRNHQAVVVCDTGDGSQGLYTELHPESLFFFSPLFYFEAAAH